MSRKEKDGWLWESDRPWENAIPGEDHGWLRANLPEELGQMPTIVLHLHRRYRDPQILEHAVD